MKGAVQFSWLFLVGAALLGLAAWLFADRLAFIHGAKHAQGQVVEMVRRTGAKFSPRVRFTAADGTEHVFISPIRSNLPSVSTGEQVAVLYDGACQDRAVIDSFVELWGGVVLVGFLGVAFTVMGAVMFVHDRRGTRGRS